MNLKDKEKWNKWVESNQDPYGNACVKVAGRLIEILDGGKPVESCHKLICKAGDESGIVGTTGFMAEYVAQIVSECHERGEEFRKQWNIENQISVEGEKANDEGTVLNPALLSFRK